MAEENPANLFFSFLIKLTPTLYPVLTLSSSSFLCYYSVTGNECCAAVFPEETEGRNPIMQKTTHYPQARTLDLIWTSMAIALVFVATLLLNIRLPIAANGGLVHLGTAMLFIIAILFGPKKGAIAGGVGMGLFDLISGWTLWAPFTLITRSVQGYIVGKVAWANGRNGDSIVLNIIGAALSIPFMLGGYYICEAILFSSWIIPAASIPGNLVQNVVGLIVAIPVAVALKKTPLFK